MTALEIQNAPFPGHSTLLGPFADHPSHLHIFILSTTPCSKCSSKEQAQWHQLLCLIKAHSLLQIFAPAVRHEALAESRTRFLYLPATVTYGVVTTSLTENQTTIF